MSLARFAKKRDKAERPIISALEAVGAEVWVLDTPVDLLTLFRGVWMPLEVKTGKYRKRKEQAAQSETIERAKIPVVTTPLEALEAMGAVKREGAIINGAA